MKFLFIVVITILVVFPEPVFGQNCELEISGEITASCTDGSSGEIILKVSGSHGRILIKWEDGSNDFHRKRLSEGIYNVTVSDEICSVSKLFRIKRHPKTNVSIEKDNDVLEVNSKSSMKDSNIIWINSKGEVVGKGRTSRISSHGSYRVILIDKNNCLSSTQITVDEI